MLEGKSRYNQAFRAKRSNIPTQEMSAEEALKIMSTTVPHEVNQALSVIIGYAELLKARGDQLSPKEIIGMALLMAKAGAEIDNKIAAIARIRYPRETYIFGGSLFFKLPPELKDRNNVAKRAHRKMLISKSF